MLRTTGYNRQISLAFNHETEEVERIRRTVQKRFNDPDNHDGVVTHLEPDILEREVK